MSAKFCKNVLFIVLITCLFGATVSVAMKDESTKKTVIQDPTSQKDKKQEDKLKKSKKNEIKEQKSLEKFLKRFLVKIKNIDEIDSIDQLEDLKKKALKKNKKLVDNFSTISEEKNIETAYKKSLVLFKEQESEIKLRDKERIALLEKLFSKTQKKLSDIEQQQLNDLFLTPTNKQFLSTIKQFIKVVKKKLLDNDFVSKKMVNKPKGFVSKVGVKDTADIVMFTDLHSDVEPLQEFMGQLVAKGWVDKDDPFKITKEDMYIVTLGDYIDRGTTGISVLYILMKLFIKNPNKVFLICGNHELSKRLRKYGFFDEIVAKFTNAKQVRKKIISVFNNMVNSVFFVQQNSDNKKRCYMLTHGGPALNFNASSLVNNKSAFINELIDLKTVKKLAWNDFDEHYDDAQVKDSRGGGSIFGKQEFVKYGKKLKKNTEIKLVGLFRGHQQVDFLEEFEDGHGIYFLFDDYQWDGNAKTKISIKDLAKKEPFVATLDFFRFAPYGENKSMAKTNASFFTLNLRKEFKDVTISGQIIKQRKINRPKKKKKKSKK
ncbi:serine/threonine protein phosphatase [bacterium]|nr:serine/threonine protein phosphatase [bacterium]